VNSKKHIVCFLIACTVFLSDIRFCHPDTDYVNVKHFIDSGDFKSEKDHTAAIRAAFAEAGKTRKYAVLFPPGNYYISDTITIATANEVVGHGYPTIHQSNPEKDIFHDDGTWRKTIRGLQFQGGRDQIAIGNKNVDQGFLIISDCRFSDSEGAAIRFLGGPGYPAKTTASTYCIVEKCAFKNNGQVLISVSDDAHFHDAWISTKPHKSNKAVIENYGNLSIENILGVPRVTHTDQRWIDNHGGLSIKKFRFGGEGAGFTPVVNYAKYSPAGWGVGIIIEDSFVFALGNNKRACAVYLEEIPNKLVIRDSVVAHVPAVIVNKKIDLSTYFDGARPGMFHFDISGNIGEFAGELPEEMIKAAAQRKITGYKYGNKQLTAKETRKALAKAIQRAKEIPSAPAGGMAGHNQQTNPAQYRDLTVSTCAWDLSDYLDGVTEKNDDYLAVAEAGDDIILLQRMDEGTSYPHVRIRNIQVDLDKTPYLTWRIKDNSRDVKGGSHAVKVINNETQGMVRLLENHNPDQYGYYSYDLRKAFEIEKGTINVDIKFYLLNTRMYGALAKDYVKIKKGEYFIIDFVRLEAENQ